MIDVIGKTRTFGLSFLLFLLQVRAPNYTAVHLSSDVGSQEEWYAIEGALERLRGYLQSAQHKERLTCGQVNGADFDRYDVIIYDAEAEGDDDDGDDVVNGEHVVCLY